MVCPFGSECDTSVIDSRKTNEGIRRRRECSNCNLRFTTYEKADISLMVQKRSLDFSGQSYLKLKNACLHLLHLELCLEDT